MAPEAMVGAYLHLSGLRLCSVILSFCNAWCTVACFGNLPSACLVQCGMLGGSSQAHLLLCPVVCQWADLRLHSPFLSPAASAASILRTLALPASMGTRLAMSLDIAVGPAGRIRHGSRCLPRSCFLRLASKNSPIVCRGAGAQCLDALRPGGASLRLCAAAA